MGKVIIPSHSHSFHYYFGQKIEKGQMKDRSIII